MKRLRRAAGAVCAVPPEQKAMPSLVRCRVVVLTMPATKTFLMLAALAATALAGCTGDGATTDDADPAQTGDQAALAPAAPVLHELNWTGYAMVGAAYDVPAHWSPPEEIVAPIWKEGFMLEVTDELQALEFHMEWGGMPGTQVMLMAHSPHDGAEDMTEYRTEFSADPVHCFRIPADDLPGRSIGHWQPMFHVLAGADVTVTVTVRAIGGGNVTIPDMMHGHDPADPAETIAVAEADQNARATDSCDGPLL